MAKETTTFEKMGDNFGAHVMNLSGAPSPYTTNVKKKGPRGSASPKTASVRSSKKIEGMGAAYCVKATLYAANAAAAQDTERNVRTLPSAIKRSDFSPKSYS